MWTGNFFNMLGDARSDTGQAINWRKQGKENIGPQGFSSLVQRIGIDIFLTSAVKAIYQAEHAGYTGHSRYWPKNLTNKPQKTDNDVRCKRLLFRSWHRGTRELDLFLGPFAEHHLATFTTRQLDAYEHLLEHSDPDIYRWITDAEPVPKTANSDVLSLLQNFKITV